MGIEVGQRGSYAPGSQYGPKKTTTPDPAMASAGAAPAAPYTPWQPTYSAADMAFMSGSSTPAAPDSGADMGTGAKIVSPDPTPPSMQALQGGGGGGGDMNAGGAESIGAPSAFRQGIGKRLYPQDSAALASLRQVY